MHAITSCCTVPATIWSATIWSMAACVCLTEKNKKNSKPLHVMCACEFMWARLCVDIRESMSRCYTELLNIIFVLRWSGLGFVACGCIGLLLFGHKNLRIVCLHPRCYVNAPIGKRHRLPCMLYSTGVMCTDCLCAPPPSTASVLLIQPQPRQHTSKTPPTLHCTSPLMPITVKLMQPVVCCRNPTLLFDYNNKSTTPFLHSSTTHAS